MSDQLAKDIRGIVDDGALPITLAELELALLDVPTPRPSRRWPVLAAAAAVAALIVATIILVRTASDDGGTVLTPAGPAPSAPAPAPPAPAPAVPLGAPLVQGPDAGSTLLTSWGQIHVGFAFVYADGRVLFQSEAVAMPKEVTGDGINERHLSPRGLDLVRAGKLHPADLLANSWVDRGEGWVRIKPAGRRLHQREELWVEPTTREWEPTKYVLCPSLAIGGGSVSLNATDIVDDLPAPVRAVLDGKQRIYDPSIGTAHWDFPAAVGMTDCFELTAAETATLYQMLVANGLIKKDQETIRGAQGWDRVFVYGNVPTGPDNPWGNMSFVPEPIFPHGQPVNWGG